MLKILESNFSSDNINQYLILINCDCDTFTTTRSRKTAPQIRPCFETSMMITKTESCFGLNCRGSNKTGIR